jgi:hypothetical protein
MHDIPIAQGEIDADSTVLHAQLGRAAAPGRS